MKSLAAAEVGTLQFSFEQPVESAQIDSAQLARVLVQVRYSLTPELVEPDIERILAEHLPRLPIRGQISGMAIVDGPAQFQNEILRTFESVEPGRRATVSPQFVAYETSMYTNRADFLDEVEQVVKAIQDSRSPARVNRIGIRYTNVFVDVDQIDEWFTPEILGLAAKHPALPPAMQFMQAIFRQSQSRGISVRSGLVPPGETVEPGIPSSDAPSWLLDIDAFDELPRSGFDPGVILERLSVLAEDAQRMFESTAPGYVATTRGDS